MSSGAHHSPRPPFYGRRTDHMKALADGMQHQQWHLPKREGVGRKERTRFISVFKIMAVLNPSP